jgi:secondary thiamine-phosphate synthase enzyme
MAESLQIDTKTKPWYERASTQTFTAFLPEMRAPLRIAHQILDVQTPRRGLHSIQARIEAWLEGCQPENGLLTVFIQHTSASLLIQENADPDVRADLDAFFLRLIPDGDPLFTHTAEGPDDMPSHIRAALTQTSLNIPIIEGRMSIGTWQSVYVYEHRTMPHRRRVLLHYLGT